MNVNSLSRTIGVVLEIAYADGNPAGARLSVKSAAQEVRVADARPL